MYKPLTSTVYNRYFARGEAGSVREAGGAATWAVAASVRVTRKDN